MLDIVNRLLSQKIGQKERLEYIKHVIESQRELEENDKDYLYSHSAPEIEESIVEPRPIQSSGLKDHCTLCDRKLGIMNKKTPEKLWEMEGKICKDCYNEVKAGVNVFDATYKEGVTHYVNKVKGKLIIQNHRAKKQIAFFCEKPLVDIVMPKGKIILSEKILFEKDNIASKMKSKIGKESRSPHLHIQYQDNLIQNPIFEIKDLEKAVKEIDHLRLVN
jgi:hypothetical protein